jgi:hypothetical protein
MLDKKPYWNPSQNGDYLQSLKTYWDITYKSPSGAIGTLIAFQAYDKVTALHQAPHSITACSQFGPEDVEVLNITESNNLPQFN